MSMSELTSSYEKKKMKFVELKKTVKRQVCNCMEFNISLLKCRLSLKEHTTTTILSKDIELKLRDNTKYCKDNMKVKKKKLMIN